MDRYEWTSPHDMIIDAYFNWNENRFAIDDLLDNRFTHIGVACNCHPTHGQLCIIDLGADVYFSVEEYEHSHEHHHDQILINHVHTEEESVLYYQQNPIPEFNPFTRQCDIWKSAEQCGVELEDEETGFPPSHVGFNLLNGTIEMQEVAQTFFTSLNFFREETDFYKDNIIQTPYAKKLIEHWNDDFDAFYWSEGLARAAREIVNSQEACGTSGNRNGDHLFEVLGKYYAWNFTNV